LKVVSGRGVAKEKGDTASDARNIHVKVCCRPLAIQQDRLVCVFDMQRVRVRRRVYRDTRDPQGSTSSNTSDGNFASIGDQHSLDSCQSCFQHCLVAAFWEACQGQRYQHATSSEIPMYRLQIAKAIFNSLLYSLQTGLHSWGHEAGCSAALPDQEPVHQAKP